MNKIKDRALTYSLLAHIRSKGQLASGPIHVFVPLVKRALANLNLQGIYSGKSITEIKSETDKLYAIDFPLPVLRSILSSIAREINSDIETKFNLFQDDSFQIKNYAFTEFEETIRIHKTEIENLEKLFKEFCQTCGENKPESSSILEFIEKNKLSLSKYLAHKQIDNVKDFTIEAQFVDYFKKIPVVYEIIRKVYLGSILAGYIEYKTENVKTEIELLFDTNFILGFLDLNTRESTHTCRKIIEITKSQGYRLSVLRDTIYETISLIKAKVENFDMSFLQKKVYPEDIYNACDRRNLNKADLERIADNLESEINKFGVIIIQDTKKFKNIAKFSSEYEHLKEHRYNDAAALHDAIAIHYVREKRTKRIKDFENVNCWFINNSINRQKYGEFDKITNANDYQPETIKADEFLNIIWLSNPQIDKEVNLNEISDIGLTSLVSLGLTNSLPKLSIIRELDENIQKYAQDDGLTDGDIVRIATRITTKQLTDLENLNKLAKEKREFFVKRLNDEAKKQKELDEDRLRKLDKVFKEFSQKSEGLSKLKVEFESKAKQYDEKFASITGESATKDAQIEALKNQIELERKKRITEENKRRREKRDDYLDKMLTKWRTTTNYELLVWVLIVLVSMFSILWFTQWDYKKAIELYEQLKSNVIISSLLFLVGTVFSALTLKKWYDKNHNYANIENYKKSIKIPDSLEDLES